MALVGGTCAAIVDAGVIAKYVDPKAFVQIVAHEGQCYELQEQPFTVLYWDDAQLPPAVIEARMKEVMATAQHFRSSTRRPGCADLTDLEILVAPLADADGLAPRHGFHVLIGRDLPSDRTRTVVHHELTHAMHFRSVPKSAADYDIDVDGGWSVEGLAMFHEDEMEDLDGWFDQFSLDEYVAVWGLRANVEDHEYLAFTYLKALKQRKGFEICRYLALRASAKTAYGALDMMLKGPVRDLEYAEFVATWLVPPLAKVAGRIDDDDKLPDSIHPPFIPKLPMPACGRSDVINLGIVRGGIVAELSCPKPIRYSPAYTVSMDTPKKNVRLWIYDVDGKFYGRARDDQKIQIQKAEKTLYVVITLDQGPIEEGLGEDTEVRIKIDTRDKKLCPTCPVWKLDCCLYVEGLQKYPKCKWWWWRSCDVDDTKCCTGSGVQFCPNPDEEFVCNMVSWYAGEIKKLRDNAMDQCRQTCQ